MHSDAHLDLDALRSRLRDRRAGADLRFVAEVDSTNRIAAELPAGAWRNGTAIFTDFQTAGRGRRGRAWHAPRGSAVLASTLFEPVRAAEPASYTMLASLAVADAVESAAGVPAGIKWPNDVQVRGRKVAGILVELVGDGDDRRVIIGTGINVNMTAPDLPPGVPATSLALEAHCEVAREAVAAALLDALATWYGVLTRAPDMLWSAWKTRLTMLGATLDIHEGTTVWSGVALEVQPDGGLVVVDGNGARHVVFAADVSVRTRGGLQSPLSDVQ
jgi:BirA family transcriptional regulator, biotin operon repressor / biotin---[acetyl-CoA-carboxylase] ligase